MSEELYRKHRPESFKQMVGQDEAVATLTDFGKRKAMPHFLLFTGPSGCGKTTLGRIVRTKMKCSDADWKEMNTADFRGIDMVRDIRKVVDLVAMAGRGQPRMWLIDEAHKLTGDAQNAFLKLLEDPPDHAYFMLATTEPQKLLPTIRTRATEIKVKPLNASDMGGLLSRVHEEECGVGLHEDVRDKIVELAEGSPRKALVLLNQVLGEGDVESALAALSGGVAETESIEIARALLKKSPWQDVAKLLKGIEGLEQQAEGIRRLVLGYMTSVALGGGKTAARACFVIDCFRDNFYDSGKAGLVSACWDALAD